MLLREGNAIENHSRKYFQFGKNNQFFEFIILQIWGIYEVVLKLEDQNYVVIKKLIFMFSIYEVQILKIIVMHVKTNILCIFILR